MKSNGMNKLIKDTAKVQPSKDDLYYDAMEALEADNYKAAEEMLLEAKDIDPDYVQTYAGLTNVYGRSKDQEKAYKNIIIAFEKVLKKFPKWPKRMEWCYLENRAHLRAIHYRAGLYADEGDTAKAEELYRLLLTLNPNDNQGVRYLIAGLYAGIDGYQINKMFDEGNKTQNWDALEQLVKEQNRKHRFWNEPRD